jgi:hypothetical protein
MMRHVLSAIGLALDLVGAITVVVGLFRPPRPLFPGWSYAPDDAARDSAFGVVGASLLSCGFTLQSMTYCGVRWPGSHREAIAASIIAGAAGAALAFVAYGLTFLIILRRRQHYARTHFDLDFRVKRERSGLRFWNQVPDQSSTEEASGGL